jgi:hypothetical protein
MADNTYNYGFRWHSNLNGGPCPKPIWYPVASGYSAAPGGVSVGLRPGDWVKEVSDGTVQLAVAGDALLGVIAEIGPYYDTGQAAMVFGDSLPAGSGVYGSNLSRQSRVGVIPGNGVVWQAMCDDGSSITTEANFNAAVHENVDMINVPVDPKAHPLIDISTHETATRQLRIVGLLRRPGVDYTGNYVPLLVTMNEGRLPPFSATGV